MTARVLIVDDDPVQRRLLDNMVRRFGHEPVVAESGDQAARLIASGGRFDCVVLDLVMPDLDGLGVLAHLRETGNPVPVIVQTAHGGIDNVVSAMRAGAVDFVVKPVGAERLQVRHADAQGHRYPQPAHAARATHRREGRGFGHCGADRR
jgi:DNA-binding NtrC family response regulator